MQIGNVVAVDETLFHIFGNSFNHPLGELDTSGTLTGFLENGSPLDIDYGRATTATIRLIQAPEPSKPMLSAVAIGTPAELSRRRVRRAS